MSKKNTPVLTPRLVVRGAAQAIDWYAKALSAETIERFETRAGTIVHAALRVHGAVIALTEEDEGSCTRAPAEDNRSPVLLHLSVNDADTVGKAMLAQGAELIIDIEDRFYGKREGRLQDPFGHLWIISQPLRELSPEEIRSAMP